jgi:dihydrofolate reductase
MPLADKLYITHVDQEVDGDAFFDKIDEEVWRRTGEEAHPGFSFTTYERK